MTENDAPVIIEAALNGVTSRARNANVPATAEEQAKDALACADAGATVIHTHAPNIAAPTMKAVIDPTAIMRFKNAYFSAEVSNLGTVRK
jgi:uncharacterized protein (DUF849 family)